MVAPSTGVRNVPAPARRARSRSRSVGVVHLDLDGFDQVHDGWGHAEGEGRDSIRHATASGAREDARAGRLATSLAAATERCRVEPGRVVLEPTETEAGVVGHPCSVTWGGCASEGCGAPSTTSAPAGQPGAADGAARRHPGDRPPAGADIGADPRCEAIVRGVLGTAHTLGLEIVAEGVGTADQARAPSAWGCTQGQGHHLGAPSPRPGSRSGPWPPEPAPARVQPCSTGGVPCVWKESIVLRPHACPLARSASDQSTGSQSGASTSRAPALHSSIRLPPGS